MHLTLWIKAPENVVSNLKTFLCNQIFIIKSVPQSKLKFLGGIKK